MLAHWHVIIKWFWVFSLRVDSGSTGRAEVAGSDLLTTRLGLAGRHPARQRQEEEGGWQDEEEGEEGGRARERRGGERNLDKHETKLQLTQHTHTHRDTHGYCFLQSWRLWISFHGINCVLKCVSLHLLWVCRSWVCLLWLILYVSPLCPTVLLKRHCTILTTVFLSVLLPFSASVHLSRRVVTL